MMPTSEETIVPEAGSTEGLAGTGSFHGPDGLKKVADVAGAALASSATIVPTASSAHARQSVFSPTGSTSPTPFYRIERQRAVPSPNTASTTRSAVSVLEVTGGTRGGRRRSAAREQVRAGRNVYCPW